MGPREFADYILPPFEHAVRVGRVRSVMNSYTDVDGVPVASDPVLLTDVLRNAWGFTGTVVSDYGAVTFLQLMHRIAETEGEAAGYALAAGIDIELPSTLCYGEPLLAEIEAGRVDVALVDRALRRVLTQKLELGLLDAGWSPEPLDAGIDLDSAGNRDIARRMAESSIVLLDNPSGLLPLQTPQRIAVIGPCADDPQAFFGCYAFPNHVIPQFPEFDQGIGIVADSLLTALRAEFPAAEMHYEPGCQVSGGDLSGVGAAVDEAAAADVVVLAVGDRAGLFGNGTSGEGCDAEDLNLPGHQPELVEAILETGRPTVLLLSFRTAVRTGAVPGSCGGNRASLLPRRGGRQRARRSAFWPSQSLRQAAGRGAPPSGRTAAHLPRAAARAEQPRRQQPRPDPGLPVRARTVLHLVPLRQPACERGGARHRRQRRANGHSRKHRGSRGGRGGAAVCRGPGRQCDSADHPADRVRPRAAGPSGVG